jgi:transcriptional regulator with XRE-family HTH domain
MRAHRERLGWSQADLAKRLSDTGVPGVYPTTIAKIEAGDRAVRVDELDGLATVFGASVDLLLGRYGDRDELTLAAGNLQELARENAVHMGNLRETLASLLDDVRYYADLEASGAGGALIQATEVVLAVVGEARQGLATLAAVPLASPQFGSEGTLSATVRAVQKQEDPQ